MWVVLHCLNTVLRITEGPEPSEDEQFLMEVLSDIDAQITQHDAVVEAAREELNETITELLVEEKEGEGWRAPTRT